jgi:hypothetical protein
MRVTEQSDGSVSDARETVVHLPANAASRELADLAQRYADQPEELARAAEGFLRSERGVAYLRSGLSHRAGILTAGDAWQRLGP